MFGIRKIATGSREDMELCAEDVLQDKTKEEFIKDKIDKMNNNELRDFVETHHPDFKEDDE